MASKKLSVVIYIVRASVKPGASELYLINWDKIGRLNKKLRFNVSYLLKVKTLNSDKLSCIVGIFWLVFMYKF